MSGICPATEIFSVVSTWLVESSDKSREYQHSSGVSTPLSATDLVAVGAVRPIPDDTERVLYSPTASFSKGL